MVDESGSPTFGAALARIVTELLDGPPERGGFLLNAGDDGLFGSLGRISAEAAARRPATGNATIAAHADHVRYSLSLMNRWAEGEQNPWADADWGRSWHVTVGSEEEWSELRAALREEARRWVDHVRATEDPTPATHPLALRGVIGAVAHLAYHVGAIRQIDAAAVGPRHGAD